MARKRHKELRPMRDHMRRKKVNGSMGWEMRMMVELENEEMLEEDKTMKRRRGKRETAVRLTGGSL